MITTVCKISYGSQTVPPIVPAVQGDTGRAISFEIADFTPPAGATATYFILKPSGEAIYNSATITDNSILCELTAQSLAEAGENRMQVRVLQGENIVTSFEVILMVRTFLGDDAIESGTEMNIFDQAVEQATEQFQENAEQIVEEVIESIPADYTALTEEVDELNERLDAEVADFNLLVNNTDNLEEDKSYFAVELTQYKVITDTGSIINYTGGGAGYCVSNYIDVSAVSKVYVTASSDFHNGCCAFYDESQNVVSVPLIANSGGTKTYFTDEEVIVPSTAKYMVIATAVGTASAYSVVGYNIDIDGHLQEEKVLTKTNTQKIAENQIFPEITLTPNKLLTDAGRIIDYTGGGPGYCVSNYIDVSSVSKVYVTASSDFHNGCCAFYDTSYNVVSVPLIANSGGTKTYFTDEEVSVPATAKYMVIATAVGIANAYYLNGYKYAIYNGLKWCCIGDSLTERNSRTSINYADYISRETGIEIANLGLSGSGYKRKYETNGAFYQRILNVPTDCDVVTIFGSGNDQEYFASAMGTASDTGTDTLGGCINTTIDNLYSIMPAVQLGIIAPTPWSDYNPANENNGMSRYTELLRQICKNRSIPFLDLYHESNLRPWDSAFLPYAYSKDGGNGVHPDETGHKLFAGRIRAFLDSLIGQY